MRRFVALAAALALCFTASLVTLGQLAGAAIITMLAIAYLIWSMSVEGHIIARAIDRAFYIGVFIAFAIFVFQYAALTLILPGS